MIRITQIPPSGLTEYARIPIRFEVTSILQPGLIDGGLGGTRLSERDTYTPPPPPPPPDGEA